MGHQGGEVDAGGRGGEAVQVLALVLPVPVLEGAVEPGDHPGHQLALVGGQGRHADAVLAQHVQGDPLPGLHGDVGLAQGGQIAVGVGVQEARADDQARTVDLLCAPQAPRRLDGGDAAALDGQVGRPTRGTAAVHQGPAA